MAALARSAAKRVDTRRSTGSPCAVPGNGRITTYLRDARSVEDQALVQMLLAPPLVTERLRELGAGASLPRNAVMSVGGLGFVLFAVSQPDTSGKLAAHAYSYEHLELAGYEMLAHLARREGDAETEAVATRIGDQEAAMARRIAALFDESTDAALSERPDTDVRARLVRYLKEAHAIEGQARVLLSRARRIGGSVLRGAYEHHLGQTEEHRRVIEERLRAHHADRSRLRDVALEAGGLNWSLFFQVQPDTAARLAAFAFAFENLEIGSYEQLRRVATRAGDEDTVHAVERILTEEREAAAALRASLGATLDETLAKA
jgi:ferritin-like metal-binding protein YciE